MHRGSSERLLQAARVALLILACLAGAPTNLAGAAEQTLVLGGSTGGGYSIEGSDDLQTWVVVRTVENVSGALEIPFSELGGHAYYRVAHAGSADLRAVGLAVYQSVTDPAVRGELRLAARDQALTAIANSQDRFTAKQVTELFSNFATQEAFNATLTAGDASEAAGVSTESVNRILDVLTHSTTTVGAADLDAIRAIALSTGLAGGLTSNGGSIESVLSAVTAATQDLSPTARDAAAAYAQIASLTASIAQLTGIDGNALLQQALGAVNAAISSGDVANLFSFSASP
jgi:hypothetical protein